MLIGANESKFATYKPGPQVAIVSLGRKEAVAQFPLVTVSGCIPGLIKSGDLFVGKTRKELGLAPWGFIDHAFELKSSNVCYIWLPFYLQNLWFLSLWLGIVHFLCVLSFLHHWFGKREQTKENWGCFIWDVFEVISHDIAYCNHKVNSEDERIIVFAKLFM